MQEVKIVFKWLSSGLSHFSASNWKQNKSFTIEAENAYCVGTQNNTPFGHFLIALFLDISITFRRAESNGLHTSDELATLINHASYLVWRQIFVDFIHGDFRSETFLNMILPDFVFAFDHHKAFQQRDSLVSRTVTSFEKTTQEWKEKRND